MDLFLSSTLNLRFEICQKVRSKMKRRFHFLYFRITSQYHCHCVIYYFCVQFIFLIYIHATLCHLFCSQHNSLADTQSNNIHDNMILILVIILLLLTWIRIWMDRNCTEGTDGVNPYGMKEEESLLITGSQWLLEVREGSFSMLCVCACVCVYMCVCCVLILLCSFFLNLTGLNCIVMHCIGMYSDAFYYFTFCSLPLITSIY